MTPEELKIIEDRCSKATPGPWSAILPDITTSNWYISRRPGEGEDGFYISCIFTGKEDADFVTHSREDIPKLLKYIKELKDQTGLPKNIYKYLEG